MHTLIKVTGDDMPAGGFLIGANSSDPHIEQLIRDLRLAYPKARTQRITGMDVVTDVVGDAE